MKNYLFKIQWCSTISARIPSRFTDKVPFLADLSVSKTHFTDKPAFLSDLSVNFWPLWWWFTDKTPFLEHLSVKPGPKRLNFYGQAAIFDHFVRNRHFWSKSFTDRRPVFIDVSVNGRDFCQMQRLINQHTMLSVKFPAKLFLLISIMASNRHAYEKNRLVCNQLQINRFFNLRNVFKSPFLITCSWRNSSRQQPVQPPCRGRLRAR